MCFCLVHLSHLGFKLCTLPSFTLREITHALKVMHACNSRHGPFLIYALSQCVSLSPFIHFSALKTLETHSPVFASLTTCVHTFTFGSGWMILETFKTITFIPHVGTSSSADDVCSSVDGFFLPNPMILVIFFPAPFPTVPVFCSDFVLFFPFPERERERQGLFNS